jgi:hypothetical protein
MSGFLATRTRSGFMKEGPGFVDPYRDIGRHFSPSLRPLCIINSVEVTKNGSDRVAQMTDQSGLGNHFVQATDADKPLWVANQLNGFPIIRFTKGDTEFLENMSPFLVTPAPATLFLVAKSLFDPGTPVTQTHGSWSYESGSITNFPDSSNVWQEGFGTSARKSMGAASGTPIISWGVITVQARTSRWRCAHQETTMLHTTTNTCQWTTAAGTGFRIGRAYNTTYGSIELAELRIYPGYMPLDQLTRITKALRTKYAL